MNLTILLKILKNTTVNTLQFKLNTWDNFEKKNIQHQKCTIETRNSAITSNLTINRREDREKKKKRGQLI